MEEKVTSPAVKGVIIAAIIIAYSLILRFLPATENKGIISLQYIFFSLGVILSAHFYAKQLRGNVTFGNVFAHTFKVVAAVAAVMAVYAMLTLKFMSAEQIDDAMQQARAGMERGNMSDDQVDRAMNLTRKRAIPFVAGGTLLLYMLIGVISALVGAAITKKNPPSQLVQKG